ncbi:MAG: UDP-N-acetylmuramoyl-L-alanyl-D-glutamate--2,6-diaminopimelate ligase [Verrucomicrobiales bacterium]
MKLNELTGRLKSPLVVGSQDVDVTSVTSDSRKVTAASIFVAVRGKREDGRRFIGQAVESGAVVVVSETPAESGDPDQVTWIQVPDARAALSSLAAALAGDPSSELKLVGITGTNGKTTTGFLCHHIMKSVWHRAGLLGTVQVDDGEEVRAAKHTTPDAVDLQGLVRRMVDYGCRGATLEVSSHGIDQKRVADLAFDALVYTNLTQDHLDYHGSMKAYAAAKFSWFESVAADVRKKKPTAVINVDDAHGAELAGLLAGKMNVVRYGFGLHTDLRALEFRQSAKGMEVKLDASGRQFLVRAPLIGRFNAYNVLAALGAMKAVGISMRQAVAALSEAPQVPGRMEFCGSRDGVSVFVDYAHTPDALENACRTLKDLEPRRLITVFGCGGDRDRAKRPLMARAAARYSNVCVITSDNPRSESPSAILSEIEKGMGDSPFKSVEDRAEAIRIAVHAAGKGDIVLIAGKGHETYQEFANHTVDFDDRNQARISLNERPPMEDAKKR